MKKQSILVLVIVVVICAAFISFLVLKQNDKTSGENQLEKEGYTFVESQNWYEKNGENQSEIFINLTETDSSLMKTYAINSDISKLVFIGDPQVVYTGFNIVVNARSTNFYLEFNNFNYKASTGKIALDLSSVIGNQKVYLLVKGISSITGGKGANGKNGISHNYNSAPKHQIAENGGDGVSGQNGMEAIIANNLYIDIDSNARLSLHGGLGGNGGVGGNGAASQGDGIAQAGHAGSGGSGGSGGNALSFNGTLSIDNKGECIIQGGDGGAGGKGGHGGENLDKDPTDRADHGGNGGNGGSGGNGGYGIYSTIINKEVKVAGNLITVQSGAGGVGGNGGIGGSSCKNELQSSNGGNPGNAGNGGSGGNANMAVCNCSLKGNLLGNKGGNGGKKGTPGYNPEIGYGKEGNYGMKGVSTVE